MPKREWMKVCSRFFITQTRDLAFMTLEGDANKTFLRKMDLLKQMTAILVLVICIFMRNTGDYGKNNGSFRF